MLRPDNITRALLVRGTPREHINTLSVTGLTSNPAIIDNALRTSSLYDTATSQKAAAGMSHEDLTGAADDMPGRIDTRSRKLEHGRNPGTD